MCLKLFYRTGIIKEGHDILTALQFDPPLPPLPGKSSTSYTERKKTKGEMSKVAIATTAVLAAVPYFLVVRNFCTVL
jgi:hypothetical protein